MFKNKKKSIIVLVLIGWVIILITSTVLQKQWNVLGWQVLAMVYMIMWIDLMFDRASIQKQPETLGNSLGQALGDHIEKMMNEKTNSKKNKFEITHVE